MRASSKLDYCGLFNQLLLNCLLLDTNLYIVAASDAFYQISHSAATIVGQYIFDPFPMNEYTKQARPEHNHLHSLKTVIVTKRPDRMPIQRYDLRLPIDQSGNYVSKWWQIDNYPILDDDGEVRYILKVFEDVSHMIDRMHGIDEAIAKSVFKAG